MKTTSSSDEAARKQIFVVLLAINAAGFILSAYAHHVTVSKTSEANYEALCDISPAISCSRVLTSEYSKGFGLMEYFVDESSILNQTNSILGMIFYSLLFVLSFSDHELLCKLHLILSVFSNIGTVYLACILFILRDFCFVCVLTYVVNALNFAFVYKKDKLLYSTRTKTKKYE